MLDVVRRSLDYMLLLESETDLASPVVEPLLEVVQLMDSTIVKKRKYIKRGRPRIMIRQDQLCCVVENGFRINDIASIYLCSGRTIERRMAELSGVTADNDLDHLVE